MGELNSSGPQLICFEDEHLLVVNKPAGINTHAPSPYAGEGIYDWLRHREPRWARLAILHRLDKETSGVLVFGKTPEANRSLTQQFTEHTIRKTYRLLTEKPLDRDELVVVSSLFRAGEKYVSRPFRAGAERAETRFRRGQTAGGWTTVMAEPITGRTHQIRVHAAGNGIPILGDTLYGGTAAERVYLHAEELRLKHPVTEEEMVFRVEADFGANPRGRLRELMVDQRATNAFRLINGAADGVAGWYVDRVGEFFLSHAAGPASDREREGLQNLFLTYPEVKGAYHKQLNRKIRQASAAEASPEHVLGSTAPERFTIQENAIQYEMSFNEGYSAGLFLDQRDNRRRFLTNHVGADFPILSSGLAAAEILNAFAYTCGFSVCAAKTGARTTSIDLSKKYLEWGKRNFALNGLDPGQHDFIYGDVFEWMRRLAKKGRVFDVVVLDPPTFSQSKQGGTFQAEKDYGRLVDGALPLLKQKGVLFASSNAANLEPEKFLERIESSIAKSGRKILQRHYVPQPMDFRIARDEPAYLKTIWLRVG